MDETMKEACDRFRDDRIASMDRLEANLLKEFRKYAWTDQTRSYRHDPALLALTERIACIEARLNRLERK